VVNHDEKRKKWASSGGESSVSFVSTLPELPAREWSAHRASLKKTTGRENSDPPNRFGNHKIRKRKQTATCGEEEGCKTLRIQLERTCGDTLAVEGDPLVMARRG